jgi:hypothetical protein
MKSNLLIIILLSASFLLATTYEVKLDGTGNFTSIQAGIDASVTGDTVLVYPGTYYENINYNGKNITVASLLLTTGNEEYIAGTIIDANHNGRVVTFENNETNAAVLMGFTIQHGFLLNTSGGGVYINHSSPSLKFLNIHSNTARGSGGILISSSNVYLEAVTISNNHSFSIGGGLAISRFIPNPVNSYPVFSTVNKCSIYNNTAGWGSDIIIAENHTPVTTIPLKTFTIENPGWDYISQYPNLNLQFEEIWLEQVEHNLYVAPDGDDENSGISWDEPLQTIQWALTKIKADSLNPRTIYLAPGIFSPETNGEKYPLNMRSYVSIIGACMEETILTCAESNSRIMHAYYDDHFSIHTLKFYNSQTKDVIYSDYSPSVYNYVKFINNHNSSYTLANGYADILIKNVVFKNNKNIKTIAIGGYYNPSNAIIENVIFSGNEKYPGDDAGGTSLGISNMNNVHISNCLFYKNHVYDSFYPISHIQFMNTNKVDFFNNTVTNNSGPGSVIYFSGGNEVNIKNSIIYGNSTPYLFSDQRSDTQMVVNISDSIIEGGTEPEIIHIAYPAPYTVEYNWGENILNEPPLFLGGDWDSPLAYQLAEFSPAIDSGTADTTGLHLPFYDLLGNVRIWDGNNDGFAQIDLGCYEYGSVPYVSAPENALEVTDIRFYNFPNPFNPETTIFYELQKQSKVGLSIFNMKGQKVKTLINRTLQAGEYRTVWDGKDENGQSVSSGIYLYKLNVNGKTEGVKRCLLLK